jgi:Mrp family chromosome partitioning ATPase
MSGPRKSESAARRLDASASARRIAQHWRGGVLVGVVVCVCAMGVARLLHSTYESTALVEVTTQAGSAKSGADSVASEIRQVTLDRVRLDEEEQPDDAPTLAEEAISIEAVSDHTFSLSFRASTAEGSQRACGRLADAVVAHFGKGSNSAAREDLQRHTKELADFVSAHPDAFQEAPEPTSSSSTHGSRTPSADPALAVLRQQKISLEAELAKAEAEAAATPHEANPYDDATDRPKIADIARQLAEVRQALISHQRELTRRAAAAPSGSPEVTPAIPTRAALREEREKLVRAVIDAQQVSASAPSRQTSSARILRPPSLPDGPIKPNRWMVRLVPVVLGAWAGLLWAVMRFVARQNRAYQRRLGSGRPRPTSSFPPNQVAAAGSTTPPRRNTIPAPHGSGAFTANPVFPPSPALPALGPGPTGYPPAATGQPMDETTGPRTLPNAAMLEQLGRSETMLGMVDPSLVRTQIGGTPMNLLGRDAAEGKSADVTSGGTLVVEENGQVIGGTKRPSSDAPPMRDAMKDPRRVARPPNDATHTAGERPSSKPPRPAPRPQSESPKPPRERQVGTVPSAADLSPFAAPVTQRFGSGDPNMPKTLSPPPPPPSVPPRPDRSPTSYSFIDQSRRSKAPPPANPSNPPARRSEAPEEGFDEARRAPAPSQYPKPDIRPRQASQRPVMEREIVEERESRHPLPARAGVREPVKRIIESPSQSDDDAVVAPRSVPVNWRLRSDLEVNGKSNEILAALSQQVRQHSAQRCFVLAVVSESSMLEAKSMIAARLSTMLANDGERNVLLLEANFDFPAVHRLLGVEMPSGAGFSQQLRARIRGTRSPWRVIRTSETLQVLAEGIVRSPGILLSREFADALAELRGVYDIIVIDGPIAGQGVEMNPIDDVCDGIAIVSHSSAHMEESLNRARRWFSRKELFAAVPAEGGVS